MNCDCVDWQENMPKVIAPGILATALRYSTTDYYDVKPFAFCPWCGSDLEEQAAIRKNNARLSCEHEFKPESDSELNGLSRCTKCGYGRLDANVCAHVFRVLGVMGAAFAKGASAQRIKECTACGFIERETL